MGKRARRKMGDPRVFRKMLGNQKELAKRVADDVYSIAVSMNTTELVKMWVRAPIASACYYLAPAALQRAGVSEEASYEEARREAAAIYMMERVEHFLLVLPLPDNITKGESNEEPPEQ